ncbi:inorganic phosphate cotransporter [Caerostris extrusa]|uniref:Inorganic phosphate cotransporter n=1 Tax=Caerostris extrusa TaxID=172846 RepID=A0AAV4UMJ6_CAEEX|nr:inorganic phosphate cotransporter [Caerostris extrusa]
MEFTRARLRPWGWFPWILPRYHTGFEALQNDPGAACVALYSSILTSITTLVTPICATWHVNMMIAILLIRGVGQGCLFVSLFDLMAKWFPRKERGLLSTFVISGYSLGSTVASAVTGCICDMPSMGWSGVFYIFGGFGVLHAVLTIYLLYESPKDHPRISSAELVYLSDNEECGSNSNLIG